MPRTASCALDADPGHIGRSFYDVLGRDRDLSDVLALAFTGAEPPNRAELRLRSSGTAIGYTLCRISDRDGTVSGAALLFKDLTRVEQLEERERLRDRLAALGGMAAAIAHEVKNPLAGIQVIAGVLKRQLPDSRDAHELLNDIINEAKMANRIVVDVLEFVRPISLQVEPVSVGAVIDEAVAAARSLPGVGHTTIVADSAAGLPDLDADRLQLRQVLTNLLTNALEALAGGGHVWITASYAAPRKHPSRPITSGLSPSRWRTTVRACRSRSPTGCSARSSRPSRAGPGWASRSCARSSTPTTGESM